MQKLFLPFRRMCLFAFYRGISTESRVPRAPHQSFAIALSSLRLHQPLSAAAVVPSPVAIVTRLQRLWRERAKSSLRTRGSILR
jgi:hypothetical protein